MAKWCTLCRAVTGGEGMILYGPQSCYRKSHHLLGHLRYQGEGYEIAMGYSCQTPHISVNQEKGPLMR